MFHNKTTRSLNLLMGSQSEGQIYSKGKNNIFHFPFKNA